MTVNYKLEGRGSVEVNLTDDMGLVTVICMRNSGLGVDDMAAKEVFVSILDKLIRFGYKKV